MATERFKPYAPNVHAVVRLNAFPLILPHAGSTADSLDAAATLKKHLEEALPPDHPVHVFVDLIRGVDLDHFVIPPGPKGEKSYHPHALFGVLAWGYLHGVRSARRLARLARQEATFVYLAGGGQPNYRTLARFRRENAAAFTVVFQQTVVLALRLGLARLGHVAVDGTKLKANTAKHKAMSYGRMRQREAQIKAEIARLVEQAAVPDATDDQAYGADSDGYSVAEELAFREARLAKIRALRERLEAEQRAEQGVGEGADPMIDAKERCSFADGDARMMLLKRGEYAYAYNAQAAVDAASGIIVAADLTNIAPDVGHLPDLVGRVRGLRAGADPPDDESTTVSADAGYVSADTIAEDGAGIDLRIAAGRDDPATAVVPKGGVWPADVFGFDAAGDVGVCPAGKLLARQVTPRGTPGRPAKDRYRADPADCAPGPLRAQCRKPGQDRRVLVAQRSRPTGALRDQMRQPANRRRYARRKVIVEPVFGQLKEDRGFTTLSLRGLLLAKAEYLLGCLAPNRGKLLGVCPLLAVRPAEGAIVVA